MRYLDTAGEIIVGVLALLLLLGISIAIPLALIWSLNTLGIASASYGVVEWLAAFILATLFLAD